MLEHAKNTSALFLFVKFFLDYLYGCHDIFAPNVQFNETKIQCCKSKHSLFEMEHLHIAVGLGSKFYYVADFDEIEIFINFQ